MKEKEEKVLNLFAEMMIEKIESIQQEWKKPWFTQGVTTSLPKNLSGREYNGMNSLMLMMQAEKHGYELPVWATFDRVTGLNFTKDKQGGRTDAKDSQGNPLPRVAVNKGEKSFPVFITTFTCVNPETKEKIKYDDYKRMSEEERAKYNVYPKLQVYNVFNVSQTNIKEARPELYQNLLDHNTQQARPELKEGEQFSFPALDHMIEHNEWICPIKPTYGDDAYYSISKAEIVIPEKKQFKSGESFYSNLAHEMAHSTGAVQHLNRLKPTSFGSKEYAREELVAELTAALTSQRYGMSKVIKDDCVPYLKNWLDSLKEKPSYIKTVLLDVKKASSMINQRVDKVQMELNEELAKVKEKTEIQQQSQEQEESNQQMTVKELGIYEIPEWALNYIINGDAEGLTDKEQEMVDKFLEETFPDGFIPEVVEGSEREFSVSAAFGERNPNTLPNRGESPYVAQSTVEVKFSAAGYFEVNNEKQNDESMEIVVDNTEEQSRTVSETEEDEEEEQTRSRGMRR